MKTLTVVFWIEVILSLVILFCSSCAPARYRAEYYDSGTLVRKIDVSYCPILINSERVGLDVTLGDGARLKLGKSTINSDNANKTVQKATPSFMGYLLSLFTI